MKKVSGYAVLSINDLENMIKQIKERRPDAKGSACEVFKAEMELDSKGNWQLLSYILTQQTKH